MVHECFFSRHSEYCSNSHYNQILYNEPSDHTTACKMNADSNFCISIMADGSAISWRVVFSCNKHVFDRDEKKNFA